MSTFTLAISCLTTSNALNHGLTFQVPMQYCSLHHQTLIPSPFSSTMGCCFFFAWIVSKEVLCTALDLASITSHIHSWVFFLLWLHPFILSGVISPLISSSILGTYWPGELIFQCPIFLPFHTVHGILKERILKWFAIPFSSGPCFVRTLHRNPSVLGGPTQHGS